MTTKNRFTTTTTTTNSNISNTKRKTKRRKLQIREYEDDEIEVRHREYTVVAGGGDDDTDDSLSSPRVSWKNVLPSSSSTSTSRTILRSDLGSSIWSSVLEYQYRGKRAMSDLFLPVGYPNSVREGYLSYQFYDSIQGLCSYLRGVVSTSAVLTAAGVGDIEATAMSAALQWATKDGLGLLGGLYFSSYASTHYDSHVKEFRLFADIINDIGLTLDMITPHLPRSHLLLIGSIATLCRVMCGMAAGATKGSITQHFAMDGNMADCNAKEGTQETLVSLVGMVWGIGLARYLQKMEERTTGGDGDSDGDGNGSWVTIISWGIFMVLTVVHVWANYVGVMILRLRTLNRERAEVALEDVICKGVVWVQRNADVAVAANGDDDTTSLALPSPPPETTTSTTTTPKTTNGAAAAAAVNLNTISILTPNECHESLLQSTRKLLFVGNVRLGVRLSDALSKQRRRWRLSLSSSLPMIRDDNDNDNDNDYLCNVFEQDFCNDHYALVVATGSTPSLLPLSTSTQRIVNVLIRVGCTEDDVLKSFLHAMIVRRILATTTTTTTKVVSHNDRTTDRCIVSMSKRYVDDIFQGGHLSIEKLTNLGWDDKLYLGYGRWRAQWGEDKDE